MNKIVTILMFVVLVALAGAAPALAANGPNDEPFFTLVGIVSGKTDSEIYVDVYHGNRFAKPHYGENLTVQVTSNTEYRRWTPAGCVPATFDDVDAGDTISIHGMVFDGIFVGDRVTVNVPLDCCTP